ncbi:MAG TPA: AAA family ATPase [Pirellulales bacterium]|nr:AAA family ATPase [Pirellulales bacterium]
MSTLDKAFIKAYQRHGLHGPHVPFGRQSQPAPADAASADAPLGAGESHAASSARPHSAHTKAPATLSDKPVGAAEAPPVGPVHVAGPKPAFEIEGFEWPDVVAALGDDLRGDLAALIDELLPHSRGSLAVGGCRRGEGRTTVSLVLARQLAGSGARVLVVDGDLQRPGLAEMLGTVAETGWDELLAKKLPPHEALIESLRDGLTILPLKAAVEESLLAANTAAVKELLERLQTEFDFVCIDLGPSTDVGDARQKSLFAAGIQAAVVVRDVRDCRLEQAQAVGRQFVELGTAHWAIIENFV